MFKNSIKLGLMTALSLSLLFTGCGEDTKEADSYAVQLALDSGDNDKVIKLLNECSAYSGTAKDKCYLDLGAAYFGKANFDMISLAQEFSGIDDNLTSSAKSKAFNEIIFDKLDNVNLQTGIEKYKKILDNEDSSVCNEKNYDSLDKLKKQACLSINPLLIASIIDDDNTAQADKSESSVSIEQIIQFKNVIKNAVPEIQSADLASIFNGGTLSFAKDADQNGVLDSIQATEIVLNKVNSGGNSALIVDTQTNIYTNTKLSSVDYYEVNVVGSGVTNKFYRVTQTIANVTPIKSTILTTIVDTVCDATNTKISATVINGTSGLPCVSIKEDGNVTSLNDSVVTILNQPGLLESVALATESEDDTKTDAQKISNFENDLCNISGTASTSNNGLCEVDSSGKVTVTQAALIDYMNTSK